MDLRLVSRDCEFGDFSGAGFVPSASNRYASWMSMKLAMPPVLTFEDFTETEIADAQALGAEASIAVQQLLEQLRSEEHTSELQSLMRISYAVFCLKKKRYTRPQTLTTTTHKTPHQHT